MAGSSGENPKPSPGQRKVCDACHESKLLNQFGRGNGQWKKLPYCKACSKRLANEKQQRKREEARENRELSIPYRQRIYEKARRERDRMLIAMYGLSLEDYESMLKEQKSRCAICGSQERLVVDHDHESGAVRQLLCLSCNWMLGHAKEKIEILEKAIWYLKKHRSWERDD